MKMQDEQDGFRFGRRKFFFFGALFLAKPEIVVPEPTIELAFIPAARYRVTFRRSDDGSTLVMSGDENGIVRVPFDAEMVSLEWASVGTSPGLVTGSMAPAKGRLSAFSLPLRAAAGG